MTVINKRSKGKNLEKKRRDKNEQNTAPVSQVSGRADFHIIRHRRSVRIFRYRLNDGGRGFSYVVVFLACAIVLELVGGILLLISYKPCSVVAPVVLLITDFQLVFLKYFKIQA